MKILLTDEQFQDTKTRDLIPLECDYCHKAFIRVKYMVKRKLSKNPLQPTYCSPDCRYTYGKIKTHIICICANCNTTFDRQQSQLGDKHNFCSQSCAAIYNNTHKTHGYRRSKLETYLEEQIEKHYPQLECQYNRKDAINSELDFYFPTLKFAIELNGIFHYEPIYGQNKLDKIQNNDHQKFKICHELGIELCIIDTSKCLHLTQNTKNEYWEIVKNIIDLVIRKNMASPGRIELP
jgi:hypothetical protein